MLMLGVMMLYAQLFAQTRTITGRVTDAQGNAVPNVSVTVRGTNVGTTTGTDGTFSLAVPANGRVLVISSVGFGQQEITIADRTNFDVSLSAAEQSMEEVVVTAYGTARRRTFTGSVSQVDAGEIGKQQIANLSKSLEGLVPGVKTSSATGQPGAGAAIRIRGIGSLFASSAPLYVVDGQPYGGDINAINPNDVESISILKDAASAALYGARGSNGVVMITTKRGKGKPRLELQARYGVNSRGVEEYDVIRDPGVFLETYWEAIYNRLRAAGQTDAAARQNASVGLFSPIRIGSTNTDISVGGPGYNPYNVPASQVIDPATGKLNPNAQLMYQDDWEDAMYENRPRQEYIGSLSGSNDRTRYYLSLGYLNDKGYIVRSDFTRISGRMNLEQDINKWLRLGVNGSYANTKSNTTQEGNTTYQNAFFFTRRIAPIYPVYRRDTSMANKGAYIYDANGNRLYDFGDAASGMGSRKFAGTENPRATLDLDRYNNLSDNLSGRSFAEFRFLPELKLTLNYGVDYLQANGVAFQNPLYGNAAGASGRGTVSSGRDVSTNFNQLLNYNKTFGDHGVDVLLGHENYKLRTRTLSGTKENFLDPDNPQLSNAVSMSALSSGEADYAVEGYFGQVRYDYKGKYLLSGSVRRDGSSRFFPENRWGTFWSVGAGYVISQEAFMEGIDWINMLKLKASYGLRGNDNIGGFYESQDRYSVINANGQLAIRYTARGNPELTWEKNEDINLGAEFRVVNRITGSFEWFTRKTFDLLFNIPTALSSSLGTEPRNVGDMKNWGWETEVSADLVRGKDFTLRLGVNATHWKNEITTLPENYRANGITTGNFKYMEGKSVYDFFLWEYAGVDPATGEALYNKDVLDNQGNPTGKKETVKVQSQGTRYYLGKTAINDVYGGIDLFAQYKGFDFSVLTSYALGGYVYDAPYQALMYAGGGDVTTWHRDILNRWTPGNTGSNIPKIQHNYQEANSGSDRWLVDASYFSIRNISLGYTLPTSLTERFGISGTRFYVVADNVKLFSKRQGLDPRQDFAGGVFNAYAPIRTLSVGINTSF